MKKFPIILAAVTLLLIVGGVFLFSAKQKPLVLPTGYEFFYGEGCPHCKIVEDFLSTWTEVDKVNLTKYETWSNIENAKMLTQRFDYCKTPSAERGVPVLFTPEGKCLIGDTPVIDKLKEVVSQSAQTK
jgi:glutaredoxin